MKTTLISSAVAACLAACLATPAMAQNATLDQVSRDLQELKTKNERLEAEVEYLKESTKAQRKDAANEAVEVASIKSTANKFSWSGDFRYRHEEIKTAPNSATPEHSRGRDRIRARFGVSTKVNDNITAKLQIATAGGATGDPRSTNQTLGEDWSRKTIGIDQAYVDWKMNSMLNLQLGKTPMPWTRTASYFWDGDLTPEGAALKFARGNFFGGVFYDWLNERDNNTSAALRSDSKMVGAQFGIKQPIGASTLTGAIGYFDVTHAKDEVTSATALSGTPATTCAANGTFFGGSTNGNTTFDNNGSTASGCNALLSDFNLLNALVQFDFKAGNFPMSVFVDYMQNNKAEVNPVANDELDTAIAAGITFNKASAAKSWEVGVVYQITEKDAVFGQFVDSDFGDGKTDADGYVLKAAWVPATNWTLSGTYIINKLNNDGAVAGSTTHDLDYKRLQLDLNYKF